MSAAVAIDTAARRTELLPQTIDMLKKKVTMCGFCF
jgi:hypothetical protein